MENINLIIDKIQPVLSELAAQLGVATDFLWKVLIKEQYVDGATGLIWAIAGMIFMGIFWKYWSKLKTDGEDDKEVKWGLGVFFSFLLVIPIFFGLSEALHCFINPEYQALKDIFQMISSAVGG